MKKAFSLIELIIVIVIVSAITSFLIGKYASSINSSAKATIKADIALINSSISKENSRRVLVGEEKINYLDNAVTNQEGLEIFNNILQSGLLSTSLEKKELGKWIKTSSFNYKAYFTKDDFIEFKFQNDTFSCVSELNLCKEFE